MPKTTAVEDLFVKRDLLNRYRKTWERELNQAALTPQERARIVRDIATLGSIDEDLLRLERLLQCQILGADESGLPKTDNDEIRDQILERLHAAAAVVPADALCAAVGIDKTRLRNLMRPLLKNQQIVSLPGGYRAVTASNDPVLPGATAPARLTN